MAEKEMCSRDSEKEKREKIKNSLIYFTTSYKTLNAEALAITLEEKNLHKENYIKVIQELEKLILENKEIGMTYKGMCKFHNLTLKSLIAEMKLITKELESKKQSAVISREALIEFRDELKNEQAIAEERITKTGWYHQIFKNRILKDFVDTENIFYNCFAAQLQSKIKELDTRICNY